MDSIKDKWTLLERDALSGAGYVQRQVFAGAPLALFAAMELTTRKRVFRYCISENISRKLRQLNSSTGLELTKFKSPSDYGSDKIVHQVALSDDAYSDLFDVLLQDLCERVTACRSESEASDVIVSRLADWQTFLMLQGPVGLSQERQRGLYGELAFLRLLMTEGIIDLAGLGCWRGPSGADQDFQLRSVAVECKVSVSSQNQEIVVSSERQLDPRGYSHLYVAHWAVSAKRHHGETLPEIVADLRAGLPITASRDFEVALFDAGYLDAHRARYEELGYTIREENLFEVRNDFPRICENEVRNGVGKVQYRISVPACKPYSVGPATLLGAIKSVYA